MILKFMDYGWFGKTSWEIISDVTSIRHISITKEEKQKLVKENHSLNAVIDMRNKAGVIINNSSKVVPNVKYKFVQAWNQRNQTPLNIVTNMPVYLLNDEGKTVEKIN